MPIQLSVGAFGWGSDPGHPCRDQGHNVAPCFLSCSITFLVNQSFGVSCLLARFRKAKYSNAAIKGPGGSRGLFLHSYDLICQKIDRQVLSYFSISLGCKVGGPHCFRCALL